MTPSRDLTPKELAIGWGQQYAKENAIYATFENRVAGLLGTLPGATVVEGRKNELEFQFLGRTHLLTFRFVKMDSGFQGQVNFPPRIEGRPTARR